MYVEELENFKPIRPGIAKDVERFADLLDIAVINLKGAGRYEELGNGSLYTKLQKKMTEQMLAQYHRWVHENQKAENVETLREWIIQEAEFYTIASETLRGVSNSPSGAQRRTQSFFSDSKGPRTSQEQVKDTRQRACRVCGKNHPI